ncbi:MAG: hypothetical protein ACLQVJ_19210 [Syntrophobacteraceae bacterium]
MDLNKLVEPYSEEGKRTIEAQVKWLLAKNIARHHIDQAILTVYDEMERGKVFLASATHNAGHHLDHELLRVAQELQRAELSDSLSKLEKFHNDLCQRHKDIGAAEVIARMQKPLNWLQRFGKWLFRL